MRPAFVRVTLFESPSVPTAMPPRGRGHSVWRAYGVRMQHVSGVKTVWLVELGPGLRLRLLQPGELAPACGFPDQTYGTNTAPVNPTTDPPTTLAPSPARAASRAATILVGITA
jgi:hypothetical protein